MSISDEEADRRVNPPCIGVRDEDALCPPLEVGAYMQWIKDNQEALKAFFGPLNVREPSESPTASEPDNLA